MIFTSTISPPLKIGLQVLGIWPDMPYTILYRFSDLENFVDPLAQTLYYILTVFKVITLWANYRLVHELLAAMDNDWRECVNIDQHLHLMKTKASNSQFCTNVLLSFNLFAATLYWGGDNLTAIMHMAKGDNDTLRPFPVKVLFPSAAQQSPFYELLVVLLFFQAMSMTYTVAILNSLLSTLVLHTSGQIDIICQELRTISVSYYGSTKTTTGLLIEKHNKVIAFSENVDKLFSFIALLQVFSNTSVICLLALIAITSADGGNDVVLVKTIFAYTGIAGEIFIFCFVGEYLRLKSKSLADAGYNSLWYNMSPSHSKNILFIIMRSQKQLTITAGGMVNLSLEAFTSIMKTSASYISVLHAMY